MKKFTKFNFGLQVHELEAYISKQVKRIITSALNDINAAIKTKLENLQGISNAITAEFNVVREKVGQWLQPEIEKLTEKINQFETSGIIDALAAKIDEAKQASKSLIADISRTVLTYNWKWYFICWVAIFAINMVDSIFNAPIYQIIVTTLLFSIIVSVFIAGILMYFSHLVGTKARIANTPKQRMLRLLFGIASAAIIFLILGFIRKAYTGEENLFVNSPFVWMILNTFFFTVAVLISYYKMPTEEQKLEHDALKAKKKELAKLQLIVKIAERDMTAAVEEYNATKQRREEFISYRDKCLSSLDKEEALVIATCKKEAEIKGGTFN
ncbi:MAG TPA: hypothetical protein PLJ00_12435 [Chitinophagales bacterium]|nr:hypothetical protein [Chitinophagales bacterium]HRG28695.1 hypothetical protein [Chitinophagales bacterium]HRG84541.1 hypothetical protein [Chitinophagales bacterium]HRH53371.1 hypothetical protein [Chitinophagales bacterium]